MEETKEGGRERETEEESHISSPFSRRRGRGEGGERKANNANAAASMAARTDKPTHRLSAALFDDGGLVLGHLLLRGR